MSSKCSRCVYGKVHYSEEIGYDYICSLSDDKSNDCMLGTKDFFKGCNEETYMFMVPFCGKCGHLIKEKIGIDRVWLPSDDPHIRKVEPLRCEDYVYPKVYPNCKAHLTRIFVPSEEGLRQCGYDAKKYLPGGTH